MLQGGGSAVKKISHFVSRNGGKPGRDPAPTPRNLQVVAFRSKLSVAHTQTHTHTHSHERALTLSLTLTLTRTFLGALNFYRKHAPNFNMGLVMTDATDVRGIASLHQWKTLTKNQFDSFGATHGVNRDGTLRHFHGESEVLVPLGHHHWK